MFRCFCVPLIIIINAITLAQGKCELGQHGNIPISLYNDLRCTPIYNSAIDKHCPVKYDCSHIYNRPKDTCHFRGKSLKIGEIIDNEELSGVWDRDCSCTKNLKFECPQLMDGCAESWVSGYPSYGCYLRHELNSYCASGEICPPFDGNAKCKVKGETYREGDIFTHPDEPCVQCACAKGFDGKFEKPFCQPVNCTAELQNSNDIDNYCAPYFDYEGDYCCPKTWVCPSESGKFTPSLVGIPHNQPASEFFCKFGDNIMHIGDYYEHEDKELGSVYCECTIPPYAVCRKHPKSERLE